MPALRLRRDRLEEFYRSLDIDLDTALLQVEWEADRLRRIAANEGLISDEAREFARWAATLSIRSDDSTNPRPIPFALWPAQQWLAERWQARESQCLLKARQLGISWEVAAYLLWRAAYHGWACGYTSLGQDEARLQLGTLNPQQGRVRWLWDHMPEDRRPPARWTADSVQFPSSGGMIRVFASTPTAGTSYTFQLHVLDEFSYHPYGASNLAAVLPTLSAGGQTLVLSTANQDLGSAGAFHDTWYQASEGVDLVPTGPVLAGDGLGTNLLRAVFIGVLGRPDRNRDWLAAARARIGDPDRADAQYPETPEQAFVGRAGLVFPQFTRDRHVVSAHPLPWAECRVRAIGIDIGGGDPTAVTPLGMYQRVEGPATTKVARLGLWGIHQVGEFYEQGAIPYQDLRDWCQRWEREHGAKAQLIYVDAGSGTAAAVETLRVLGLTQCQPGWKDPAGRRQWTADLLEDEALTIHESCVNSIHEFAGYRWLERADPNSRERYKTATPVEHHADAIDARGEAIQGLVRVVLGDERRRAQVAYDTSGKVLSPREMTLEQYHEYVRGGRTRKAAMAAGRMRR